MDPVIALVRGTVVSVHVVLVLLGGGSVQPFCFVLRSWLVSGFDSVLV